MDYNGRRGVVKKDYYFTQDNRPSNLEDFNKEEELLFTGVTCYENFFTNEELRDLEKEVL